MELNWLRYFYEVANRGGFTGAARSLKISQPGVSKIVSQLEASLGFKLFFREGKTVSLTDAGRVYFERAKIIFDEEENLEKLKLLYSKECVGDLSVGGSDNLLTYLFSGVLKEFFEKFDRVNLRLFAGASNQIKSEMFEKRVEIGFFFTPLTGDEKKTLHAQPITDVEFVLVGRPGLFKGLRNEWSAADFNRQRVRYIGSRPSDYAENNPALRLHYQHLGLKPEAYIQVNNHEVIKRLCLQGLGYTLLPSYMVKDEIQRKELLEIRTDRVMRSNVYAVKRKAALLSRPAREFMNFTKGRLR